MSIIGKAPAAELDGDMSAWRNLLWDSARMLQAGRPDLASRFGAAAREVERYLRTRRQVQGASLA